MSIFDEDKMVIFYIGPLQKGGTCLERMEILQTLGCKIIPFDTSLFYKQKNLPVVNNMS